MEFNLKRQKWNFLHGNIGPKLANNTVLNQPGQPSVDKRLYGYNNKRKTASSK